MGLYSFAEFVLDVDEHRLLRNGAEVRLRGKLFETLSVFVENPGKLLRKDQLLAAIWRDRIVEENNLDHCVSQLRKILGDQVIETVPRQGYRFRCPVNILDRISSPEIRFQSPKIPAQQIQTFLTEDGVSIAYSRCGDGPPLVKAANW